MKAKRDLSELKRISTPDLRPLIEDRFREPATSHSAHEAGPARRLLIIGAALGIAGLSFAFTLGAFSSQGLRVVQSAASITGDVLTGKALADDLGLIEHTRLPGEELSSGEGDLMLGGKVLADCVGTPETPQVILQMVDESRFYCVVTATKLEGWEIAQRLIGHIPSQKELDEKAAFFEGDN